MTRRNTPQLAIAKFNGGIFYLMYVRENDFSDTDDPASQTSNILIYPQAKGAVPFQLAFWNSDPQADRTQAEVYIQENQLFVKTSYAKYVEDFEDFEGEGWVTYIYRDAVGEFLLW